MSTVPTYKPLEIEVTDFGPIAKAKLDLRPLTVFVGPSNTGKSYLAMLIYALHRFFGGFAYDSRFGRGGKYVKIGDSSERFFNREIWSLSAGKELSEEESSALIEWAASIFSHAPSEDLPAQFHAPVPEAIAALVRPLLRDVRKLRDLLEKEVARCFGSENAARLIRYGSERGFGVALKRRASEASLDSNAFAYELTVKPDESKFTALIPDTSPMQIRGADDDPWYGINVRSLDTHFRSLASLDTRFPSLASFDDYQRRIIAQSVLDELANVVGTNISTPLNREAHYLPADRAGVMHTHRVVVASLIQRSSRASLQRDEPLPTLSGVLADFLEQLLGLGNSASSKSKVSWNLPQRLEEDVLRGRVREEESATGYPTFSYQPAGREEEIPLMQASSMVSELAPVVLYLRHVVQPGDVLIIEEPESHLHPGMQAAFMRQLAAVVRAGVRVMLTTHSDYVLEELANLVRMSDLPEEQRADLKGTDAALSSDEVGVWLFEPGQQQEGSVVREIPLDEDSGTFPAGYGAITEALYNTSVEIDSRIIESKNDQ